MTPATHLRPDAPVSDWTAGYYARKDGARRIPPYPAPDTPPGSAESTAWANRCRSWTAGWDARNLEQENRP